ncbi:spectrin alpha chain, non-erythrocytic 1-like [Nothobranchius furzeri]|uniref:spectrin alpha chain, non-erythrocytic 1-like n=1 Tax=Nothobranchius furzeri TaxID=105023 RepID=UPI003904D59C
MLEKSCKKFMLFRKANELQQWINEKEGALTNEEVGSDLKQVEVLQKKFDDFQKDLKANESRLRDINKVASELESEGLMAEEAPMVQAQQQEHLGSAPGKVRVVLRLHQNQTWCFCYHSFVCLFVYRMKLTLRRHHPGSKRLGGLKMGTNEAALDIAVYILGHRWPICYFCQ